MSNHNLREEILKNIELDKKNRKEQFLKKSEEEHFMTEYAIQALKGLVFRKFKQQNSFNQIEYEYSTAFFSKTRKMFNPHIKCNFPRVYFQISNYTEFYSLAEGYKDEHFLWDDERVTEHQLTATNESTEQIIRALYDELYKEDVLFVFEVNDENDSSLTHEIISCDKLLKIVKKCSKSYPFNSLHLLCLLLYLEKR